MNSKKATGEAPATWQILGKEREVTGCAGLPAVGNLPVTWGGRPPGFPNPRNPLLAISPAGTPLEGRQIGSPQPGTKDVSGPRPGAPKPPVPRPSASAPPTRWAARPQRRFPPPPFPGRRGARSWGRRGRFTVSPLSVFPFSDGGQRAEGGRGRGGGWWPWRPFRLLGLFTPQRVATVPGGRPRAWWLQPGRLGACSPGSVANSGRVGPCREKPPRRACCPPTPGPGSVALWPQAPPHSSPSRSWSFGERLYLERTCCFQGRGRGTEYMAWPLHICAENNNYLEISSLKRTWFS
ncbi:basic proline-rich protein-like [Loxodonta africana]|uniref:basic proline-rich protein-like n=1 Tax=Loxodonta africana TaxID=9785 RepID=UPI0030D5001D